MTDQRLTFSAGATAFGDANHPSTKLALHLLEVVAEHGTPYNMLDMGCGSGILALRAAQLWHIPIVAADIEADSVRATLANAQTNGCAQYISAYRSDGYTHPKIQAPRCYALICANILPEILIPTAHDAVSLMAEEGLILLSGILEWREHEVLAVYEAFGLKLVNRAKLDGWAALLMQKQ